LDGVHNPRSFGIVSVAGDIFAFKRWQGELRAYFCLIMTCMWNAGISIPGFLFTNSEKITGVTSPSELLNLAMSSILWEERKRA
jgi:hypothetical protein